MENQVEILTEDEINNAIPRIFKRSQTDLEFRKLCLSNPTAAIREITGKSLPEGFKLQFLDTNNDPRTES